MSARTAVAAPPAGWRNRITGSGEEAPDQLLANPANWRIRPIELENERVFQELHPEGPWHCDGCCPPPPLLENPEVQRALRAAAAPEAPPAPAPRRIRRCGTCHQELGEGHVCRLEDLPKSLQAVVLAVAEAQRGGG